MADRAAVFLPWFGAAPGWERQFLHRASAVKSLTPVLVGDAASWVPEYADAIRIPATMDEFESRASEVSGVAIHKSDPDYPRGQLLCELRPMMAHMYSDAICGYGWWGYGDWDVVWGDWDSYFASGVPEQYDVVTTNGAMINGPLTLLRNTPHIVELYRRRPDILLCPYGLHHLDETGMDQIVREEMDRGRLRCLYMHTMTSHDQHEMWRRCCVEDGKLYAMDAGAHRGPELLKFHFCKGKQWPMVE